MVSGGCFENGQRKNLSGEGLSTMRPTFGTKMLEMNEVQVVCDFEKWKQFGNSHKSELAAHNEIAEQTEELVQTFGHQRSLSQSSLSWFQIQKSLKLLPLSLLNNFIAVIVLFFICNFFCICFSTER